MDEEAPVRRSTSAGIATTTIVLSLGLGLGAARAEGPPRPDPAGAAGQVVSSLLSGPSGRTTTRPAAAGSQMTGRFVITSGSCTSGAVPKGSYFSMLDPSGGSVNNGNSPCSNQSATPLKAGTEGLTPGRMQPFASPPGATDTIVAPATFFGSPFAVGTQSPDKQSGKPAAAPTIRNDGGRLNGEIPSFQAYYNGAYYNQGAPKPDGSTPGRTTSGLTGTFDASSGAFTLDWKSTIAGGAFNNFTGVWHLEGVYRSGNSTTGSGSTAPTSPGGGTSPTTTSTSSGTTAGGRSLANTGLDTGPAALAPLLLLAGLAGLARSRPVRSR